MYQQNRNSSVNKQADYLTRQHDWAAIMEQWMLKTERYSNNEGIPPAPLPPNISSMCYFEEPTRDETKVNNDRDRGEKVQKAPRLLSTKNTSVGRNWNDWDPLNAVKVEPEEESHTSRNWSVRYRAGIENRINAPLPEPTKKGDYCSLPWSRVKVEPEEGPVSSTESSLYCIDYVERPSNRENISCCEHLKELQQGVPEKVTAKLSRKNNATLGYDVFIENPRNGILSSSYQYINNELPSSESIHSEYWLPILSRIEDWPYIKEEFLSSVDRICAGIRFSGSEAEKVFKVCASLMNTAVVKIMKNGRNEADNDAYINGFFSIYRILKQYAQDEKELVESSNSALTNFMASSSARIKRAVPNLGEFIMHLTVSTQWTWKQISNVFMDELDTRNVFWYCFGNHNSPPAHPELIDLHQYRFDREAKVFHATTISRNLVMFQVKFANMTKSMEFTEFCTNFGRVQDILTAKLKNLFGTVVAIKNWDQFYDFLQMPRVSLAKRNSDLARAVTRSAAQGYHKRKSGAMSAGTCKKRRMR
ncbi:uncharacterized protein LOC119068241 isoform X2 [Bradysia coprophila]|uniref:uncharacterized protein LOC119068241 isoform X2 n=1 Tax=Bradysia coprophila TaxID=38358 RepID=UPI00187DC845|nr:uncharacterized protein LOC119068241 isoform X2 [Bradysia coprophila]